MFAVPLLRLRAGSRRLCRAVAAALLASCGWCSVCGAQARLNPASPVDTDALNLTPEVREAFRHFYDLDYSGALERFRRIEAVHPEDPIAVDYVLDATIFETLYRLDLLDTTLYAHDGFLNGRRSAEDEDQTEAEVTQLTDQAVKLANARLKSDPKDIDALFARAWARSLRAIYTAFVDHGFIGALRAAVEARGDDDAVLRMDPNYADAELVVGIHQYVAGSLPLGFKLMAGLAGIHGDKSKGIALLEDDGRRGVITSVEARTALMLFLRREGKYAQAAQIAGELTAQYPHDFLFRLEQGNLEKDAGNGAQAIALYRRLLADARRPGYFPNAHPELAYFALGETLRGQKDHAGAADAFEAALRQPAIGAALRRRTELALGHEYDTLHQRAKAVAEYRRLMKESPHSPQAMEAEEELRIPYSGE